MKKKNYNSTKKAYDKQRAGARSRNWLAVIYPDDLPDDYLDKIEATGINAIISPLHNADFNADGTAKKLHRHLVLTFDSVKTAEQVHKWFGELFGVVITEEFQEFSDMNGNIVKGDKIGEKISVNGVAMPQKCANKIGAVRYLIHMDNPEKAQYDKADIICFGGANIEEMIKASADETFVMQATVESIIEEQGFTEYAVVAKYLRESDFDLYKTFTTHTMHFNAFIKSRRHSQLTK